MIDGLIKLKNLKPDLYQIQLITKEEKNE